MPTVSGSLSHSFTVSSVDKTSLTDTFLNIVKRREEILYRSNVDTLAANIAYVTNESISSSNNLSISDKSTSLVANRITKVDATVITDTDNFVIDTDTFLVTNVFTEETNTITPDPIFYKHTLSTTNLLRVDVENDDLTIDSGSKLVSVEILDQLLQPLKVPDISLDTDLGILYNNLVPEYNSPLDYTIYFVRYLVNTGGVVQTFVDLLDNEPIFRQATVDDLDETLSIIPDGRAVYLIEEVSNGFRVTLAGNGDYAFKPLNTVRLQVLPPTGTGPFDSWYVRVSNGSFVASLNGVLQKYYIGEFLTQSFFPEVPIKPVTQESSTILASNLIKLDQSNIKEDTDLELFVNIQINKADGTGAAAYTTDDSIVSDIADNGMPWKKWNRYGRAGIRSIDHTTGILEVEGVAIKDTWDIVADYSYTETNYEFTLFNFNPVSNQDARTHKVAIFVDPDSIGVTSDQTLYYLKINKSGKIVESNWASFANDTELYTPTSEPIYYENYPSFLPAAAHRLFVNEFTTSAPTSGINYLVLAEITVAEAQDVADLSPLDSRKRGGGLLDSVTEEAIVTQPEAQWYWDIGYWDGVPYPGNASYLVDIPVDVLENTPSGIFTQSEVRDIVLRHTAAGVYPLTRAYGPDVTITGVYPFSTGIDLEWYSNAG